MAINALIGLAVITVPVASDNPPRTSLQIAAAFIVGLGLSAVEWLLVISTYFDRRDRKAITRELVTPILQQQQYDEQRNSHSDTAEALGLPEEKP